MKTPPRLNKTKVTLTVDELNKLVKLASFPALNPNPVVELTLDGHIIYANPSAKKLFPKWKSLSLQHPFLSDIKTLLRKTKNANPENHITREVQVNGQTFLQPLQKYPI
jgi:transcriptional regulator of aromatic amino acid metabolism